MSDSLELNGRRALVTGGTKGVGEAVVTALRDAGAKVLTTARSKPEQLADPNLFVTADVSTPEGCATVARLELSSHPWSRIRQRRATSEATGFCSGSKAKVEN